MIIRPRCESKELTIWRILNTRMTLATKEKQTYLNLEKGFAGERKFDALMENLHSESLFLNDLLLEWNHAIFQIDLVMISQETIYHFEVKNYEGDYYFEADRFYTLSGIEIQNPLHQLERSESLLRQLLHSLGSNLQLKASLIFINPEFHLYQASKDSPIIFPAQLYRFMKQLNMKSSKLNPKHTKIAEKLLSLHQTNNPYTRVQVYDYDQLQKGMTCRSCNSFSVTVGERKLVCDKCGCCEDVDSAVHRGVDEFKLLFPDRKVTTNNIHEWCRGVESKKMIRRILSENFNAVGYGKWMIFE